MEVESRPPPPTQQTPTQPPSASASELMVPFLPRHVRQKYRDQGELKEPVMEAMDFAVLGILDISGYSKLTTALSARGNIGAELLTRILNPYFALMIETVEKYGGDIIKFAGDAIIVYWQPPKHIQDPVKARAVAAIRACRASLLLLAALGNYEVAIPGDNAIKATDDKAHRASQAVGSPSGEKKDEAKKDLNIIYLSMHIGLACGLSFNVHVGLPGRRWEFFVAGEGIRKVAPILDEAKRGELAISADMMKIMAETSGVEPRYTSNVTEEFGILCDLVVANEEDILPTAEEMDATMECKEVHTRYINESAVYRLINGQSNMLNELRNISVIFLKIGDLDYDSPTFLPMAQQALAIGLKALEQFEGSLRQMMMDDKGLTILAVFGLPPWSHENEASFALKAALQMNQKMKEAGFTHFSFGVASGVVFTGKVGSELRCDHTVLGDCVNMAARLMCSKLATNGILCDEATYVATRNLFQFFTPDPILVKGKSVPINVYKPESERALDVNTTLAAFDPNMEKTLIGRQAERELMKSLVERLVSGPINAPSSTVVIEGESGQGKTRMGRFLANTALGAGLLVTVSQSSEVDRRTPAHTIRPVVMALVDIINGDGFQYNPGSFRQLQDSRQSALKRQESSESMASIDWDGSSDDLLDTSLPPAAPAPATSPPPSKAKIGMLARLGGSSSGLMQSGGGKEDKSRASMEDARLPPPNAAQAMLDKRKDSVMMLKGLPSFRRPSQVFDLKGGGGGRFDPNIKGIDPSVLKNDHGGTLIERVRRMSVQVNDQPLVGGADKPSGGARHPLRSDQRGGPLRPLHGKPSNLSGSAHETALNVKWTNDAIPEEREGPSSPLASSGNHEASSSAAAAAASSSAATAVAAFAGFEANVKIDVDSLDATGKKVVKAMRKLSESDNLLSLFNMVLPLSFPRASLPFNRTQQAQTEALVNLLARILLKIVASAAPMLLVLEDSHWQDSLSWFVLSKLVRKCPYRCLFCIISRPSKEMEEKILQSQFEEIKNMRSTKLVNLEGLTKQDTIDLILQKFGGATRTLNRELADRIYTKTRGRALFVENVAVALRESSLVDVIAGELRLKNNKSIASGALDDVLPADVESAILVQFDKIDQQMQLVLRVASVIGQYFSTVDLAAVLEKDLGREYQPDELYDFLAEKDSANFLAPQLTGQQLVVNEPLTLAQYKASGGDIQGLLGFQSSMARQSIYNVMLFEHRETVHERVARHYENRFQEQNRFLLLPQISYHYNQTTIVEKKVEYLEAVAFCNIDIFSMLEAISNLTALIEFAQSQREHNRVIFNPQRERGWRRKLAQALAGQRMFDDAIYENIRVLQMLDVDWPTGTFSQQWARWKLWKEQDQAWAQRKASGSSKTIDGDTSNFLSGSPSNDSTVRKSASSLSLRKRSSVAGTLARRRKSRDGKEVEETPAHRQEEIISTLFALFELFWTQGRSDDSITALLMALQYCEATDAAAKEHPALLSRFACVLYLTGRKPLAAEYLAEAEEMLVLAPVLQELKVNLNHGNVCWYSGDWLKALECFENVVLLAERTGQRVPWQDAHLMIEQLWTFNGDFEEGVFTATHVYQDALDHDDIMSAVLHGLQAIQGLIAIDRINELPVWLERVDGLWPRARDTASATVNALYHSVCACASFRIREDEDAESHLEETLVYTAKLQAGPTIEPLVITAMFHLILCTMHIVEEYELAETDSSENMYALRATYLKGALSGLKKARPFVASEPLTALAEGALLVASNKRSKAASVFQKGLALPCVQNDMRYLQAVLLGEVAKASKNRASADRAQQLMEDLNCSWEMSELVRLSASW